MPFAVWLRGSLQSEIKANFLEQRPDEAFPFSGKGLAEIWNQFERGDLGWSRIWGIFVLRYWLERHQVGI